MYVDAIIDLCKLADVNHRIYRANEHDSYQLELWIESENKRLADTELYSVERNQKMKLLKGEDENKVFNSCIVKIKDELNILNEKLISAEDEEEKARKVKLIAYLLITT